MADVSPPLPEVIVTLRLDLVLVSVAQLFARAASDGPIPLGYADPHDVLDPDNSPLRRRVAQVRQDPAANPWLIRIAVLRERGSIIGLGNFHGPPDERGMVEIGYRVHHDHQGLGFAREIATGMWACVAKRPDVRWLRATVAPDNSASIAIIVGAGFTQIGEQHDPEDGLELVYEIGTQDYRCAHAKISE